MKYYGLVFFVIVITGLVEPFNHTPSIAEIQISGTKAIKTDLSEINILIFVADYVGYSYFELRDILQEMGVTITTVGLTSQHFACTNRGENPIFIDTNVTVNQITEDLLTNFDALLLPSGGYWSSMLVQNNLLDLITMAYNKGLVIGSICIGMAILSELEIINGVHMVAHDVATYYLENNGAIIEYYSKVLRDKRIISGGSGGGLSGGSYLVAPHRELCETVLREILGYSYLSNLTITRQSSNYTLTVSLHNQNDLTEGSVEFYRVRAIVTRDQGAEIKTYSFSLDKDNIYTARIMDLPIGKYSVSIEIKTNESIIEIERDIGSIKTSNNIPSFEFGITFLGLLLILYIFKNINSTNLRD